MSYNYAINDSVLLHFQGPQGREVPMQRNVYTITARMPIEADGRPVTGSSARTKRSSAS